MDELLETNDITETSLKMGICKYKRGYCLLDENNNQLTDALYETIFNTKDFGIMGVYFLNESILTPEQRKIDDLNLFAVNTSFDFTVENTFMDLFLHHFYYRNFEIYIKSEDPNLKSKLLRQYHKILWGNRILPNNEPFILSEGCVHKINSIFEKDKKYNAFEKATYNRLVRLNNGKIQLFESDSFVNTYFFFDKCEHIFEDFRNETKYKKYRTNFIRKTYTIGGLIIYSSRDNGISQTKETNNLIADRCDLTLECIRRFYNGEISPLSETIEQDREFFELFNDFKGYIDYFYLNNFVSEDYKKVNIIFGNDDFSSDSYPKNKEEWLLWHDSMIDFINKRNNRIEGAKKEDHFCLNIIKYIGVIVSKFCKEIIIHTNTYFQQKYIIKKL